MHKTRSFEVIQGCDHTDMIALVIGLSRRSAIAMHQTVPFQYYPPDKYDRMSLISDESVCRCL